jgi:hypothetical protein
MLTDAAASFEEINCCELSENPVTCMKRSIQANEDGILATSKQMEVMESTQEVCLKPSPWFKIRMCLYLN